MGLRPTKDEEDAEWKNSWQAKAPAPLGRTDVEQALLPANSGVFQGVTMGLRPTKDEEDAE